MIFRDLIVAQIEAELHKLKACASLTEVAHRERLAVRALENIRHEDHRIHRYIRVLFMSHLRFMDETRGLLADDEVRSSPLSELEVIELPAAQKRSAFMGKAGQR